MVGCREGDGEVASANDDVGVALDGGAVGRIVVGYNGVAARVDDDSAAADGYIANGLDAFGDVARMREVDAAAAHVEGTVALNAFAIIRGGNDGDVGAADGDIGVA